MKVTVTHLKAPWPAGAGVGSIVALPGDEIPGWAKGKCEPYTGEAAAEFTWEPPAPVVAEAPAAPALPVGVADAIAAAVAPLQATVEKQAETIAALQATVDDFAARAAAAVGDLVVNPASEGAAPAVKTAKAKATG